MRTLLNVDLSFLNIKLARKLVKLERDLLECESFFLNMNLARQLVKLERDVSYLK